MHLTFDNVNVAFRDILEDISSGEIPTEERASRNGEVIQVTEPVTITYREPRKRVLLNKARDANPFFHVFEALWMLAGGKLVEPVARYSSNIGQFSDDGETFNGAYGDRWRNWKVPEVLGKTLWEPVPEDSVDLAEPIECEAVRWSTVDQLSKIVERLREKPDDRRCVLEMWSVHSDLLRVDTSKDVCCNTHAYFSVERGLCRECKGKGWTGTEATGPMECLNCRGLPHDVPRYLTMTVCNRSNDLIWGLLGANVVHFSFLQEYVASKLGLDLGYYHHFTNNLHIYTETNSGYHPERWLSEYSKKTRTMHDSTSSYPPVSPRLGEKESFDNEVKSFVEASTPWLRSWDDLFLRKVAAPMTYVFHLYKLKQYSMALENCEEIGGRGVDNDWKTAAKYWITKRRDNFERKKNKGGETK